MNEKSTLLFEAWRRESFASRRELLLKTLEAEADLNPEGYEITVRFVVTKQEILEHKADNQAHVDLTPAEHLVEMIQDCLYDGGPLMDGDFEVLEVRG